MTTPDRPPLFDPAAAGWPSLSPQPQEQPMTTQPTTDPTHGLSVQHADALWDAVAIPGPTEPTFPMQHERVCRAVADILAELTPASPAVPVSSPPPDQTALRDRIAEALAAADGWTWTPDYDKSLSPVWQGYLKRADVVLPVLPPPVDGSATLREAADRLWALANRKTERGAGVLWAADWLRRLAAEAQQPDTETRTSWTPGPVALARAADWATKRQDATVDPAMCPRCKGDNSEAFQLCAACATPEPPAHIGGNADDCPACQTDGLDTIGHPYECPGPEARP